MFLYSDAAGGEAEDTFLIKTCIKSLYWGRQCLAYFWADQDQSAPFS